MSGFDPSTLVYVLDEAGVDLLIDAIEQASEVVYDLETSSLDAYRDGEHITLASFTLPRGDEPDPPTFLLCLAHPDSPLLGRWREVAREVFGAVLRHGSTIGHNVKFDARWVHAHTGVDLSGTIVWDPQVGAHLLDENRSTKLKEVAPARFSIERWDDVDLDSPGAADRVPFFDLAVYAARDTYWTWRESVEQRRDVGATPVARSALDPGLDDDRAALRLGRLANRLVMPTVRTLTAIEQRGFLLDVEETRRRLDEMGRQAEDARQRLHRLDPHMRRIGEEQKLSESWEPTARWFGRYTARALEAGRLRVVEMTPNGRPSWGKSTLRRLARDGSETAEAILSYRHATKRSQYLRSWLEHVGSDGRVHAGYNVGSVVTGRLSSSNPNMQQVSGDLKPCWIGSPGTLIAEVDYSQIELRAAAFVARCEPMLSAFRDGRDLHRIMAAQVAGKPESEVTPEERQRAKAINFGFLYGMGAAGFQNYADDTYGVVFSPEEAERARAAFFRTWDGLDRWHRSVVRQAQHLDQVSSPLGRLRRLPTIHDGNERVRGHAERQAMNSPIQSFASDLMQLAAARIEGTLPGEPGIPEVGTVATVHDSIVVEVPADDWRQSTARVIRGMLDLSELLAPMDVVLDVPLEVEAKIGPRWGQAQAMIVS